MLKNHFYLDKYIDVTAFVGIYLLISLTNIYF